MKTHLIYKLLLLTAFAAFISTSCTDIDEYKKFQQEGSVEYTGRMKSVKVLAGNERVVITGVYGSDPKVVKCRIYWNLRADYVDFPVDLSKTDILYEIIDLPENSYSFEVVTYDQQGNSSIATTATGTSYGKLYKESLYNRLIHSAKEVDAGEGVLDVMIKWRAIDVSTGASASEVTYTDNNDVKHTISVAVTENTTTLINYKSGTQISHVTLYKPEESCYDSFHTTTSSCVAEALPEPLPEPDPILGELSKALFANKSLPGDATPAAGVLGVEKIWDGRSQEDWTQRLVTAQSTPPAQWVTFDTGQTAKLTALKLWNYGDDTNPGLRMHYGPGHMKHFQIWGSIEPAPDGSWESWTLLGDFEITKPSGSPVGTETTEDHEKGVAGFDFEFTGEQPKVRYIRIKNLGNWNGTTYSIDLQEVALTGWIYPVVQ